MNLEGSLETFGLADVCALLAMTGKSGTLSLSCAEQRLSGAVWLRDGAVVMAAADQRRDVLARRVVGAGLVEPRAALAAANEARSRAEFVAAIVALVRDGDALQEVHREACVEEISQLLTWTTGDFAFDLGPLHAPLDGLSAFSMVDLLAAARATLAEGHDFDAAYLEAGVLTLNPSPSQPVTLTPPEWTTVTLVDGQRGVREIAELCGSGIHRTASVVAGLVNRGVLSFGASSHTGVVEVLDWIAHWERESGPRHAPPPTAPMADRALASAPPASGVEPEPEESVVALLRPGSGHARASRRPAPLSDLPESVPAQDSAAREALERLLAGTPSN